MTTAPPDEPDEVIQRFKALHEYDLKILRLDQELRRAPASLATFQKAVEVVEAKIKKLQAATRLVRGHIRLRENDLASQEQKVAKLKEQANTVRSNKEFVAFRSEIANTQAEADRLQSEVLKQMGVAEQADAKIGELEEERARKAKQVDDAQADIDARQTDVRQKRDDLLSGRGTYTAGLPTEPLAQYERTRRKLDKGAGVLEGGYCGACGEMLTKNEVYGVQNRTRLVFCRSCNTLLYIP